MHSDLRASFRREGQGGWCGRRDLNPHSPCGKTDFRTHPRLSTPVLSPARFGVWTIPSPCPVQDLGAARLVSTPSRPDSGRAWLGIAMLEGSPNLSSST